METVVNFPRIVNTGGGTQPSRECLSLGAPGLGDECGESKFHEGRALSLLFSAASPVPRTEPHTQLGTK